MFDWIMIYVENYNRENLSHRDGSNHSIIWTIKASGTIAIDDQEYSIGPNKGKTER